MPTQGKTLSISKRNAEHPCPRPRPRTLRPSPKGEEAIFGWTLSTKTSAPLQDQDRPEAVLLSSGLGFGLVEVLLTPLPRSDLGASPRPDSISNTARGHVDRWWRRRQPVGGHCRRAAPGGPSEVGVRLAVVDRRPLLRDRRRSHLRLLNHTADRLADSQEQARPRHFQVLNKFQFSKN